ncbi:MAG: ECF-type sigma factor [Candidatus Thiodiazotropha sp.]|jgi:RNA polymerase sigma factor (TIGR02999 family)
MEVFTESIIDNEIDKLLNNTRTGGIKARDALFAAAYNELRVLARSRLRNGGCHDLLDTTVLVHESYLRFIRAGPLQAADRRAFFAYASQVMRSVIVDNVREYQAQRRFGSAEQVELDTSVLNQLPGEEEEILKVHEALGALAHAEPRLATVVEMRYFGGFSETWIAEVLQVTERTVRRDWEKARVLLMTMIRD